MAQLNGELAKPVECAYCGDVISWRPVRIRDEPLTNCFRCGKANQIESPALPGR